MKTLPLLSLPLLDGPLFHPINDTKDLSDTRGTVSSASLLSEACTSINDEKEIVKYERPPPTLSLTSTLPPTVTIAVPKDDSTEIIDLLAPTTPPQSTKLDFTIPKIEFTLPTPPPEERPKDFSPPSWWEAVMDVISQLSDILSGLKLPVNIDACGAGSAASIGSTSACIARALFGIVDAAETAVSAMALSARVAAGGHKAEDALIKMHTLLGRPLGKTAMKFLGAPLTAQLLAQKESTSDRARNLALSLQSSLSGLPAATSASDPATGSFGHINIVMPSVTEARRAMKFHRRAASLDATLLTGEAHASLLLG